MREEDTTVSILPFGGRNLSQPFSSARPLRARVGGGRWLRATRRRSRGSWQEPRRRRWQSSRYARSWESVPTPLTPTARVDWKGTSTLASCTTLVALSSVRRHWVRWRLRQSATAGTAIHTVSRSVGLAMRLGGVLTVPCLRIGMELARGHRPRSRSRASPTRLRPANELDQVRSAGVSAGDPLALPCSLRAEVARPPVSGTVTESWRLTRRLRSVQGTPAGISSRPLTVEFSLSAA